MIVSIRNVDEKLFKQIKIEAEKRDITVGDAVNQALKQWMLESHTKKGRKLAFAPIKTGTAQTKTSEEVDDILYGSTS